MFELPIIETPRLWLREINLEDSLDMFEYACLPQVGPMAGWEPHQSINETRTIIKMFREKKLYDQLGVFVIVLKKENKMIGTVELHGYVRGFKAELGYTVSPYYWGNGYAVEASKEIIRWGFTSLHLKRIECTTFVTNSQSRRVCEKLGLRYEGVRKNGYMLYDGSIHDIFVYSITDEEFYQKQNKNFL